MLTILKICDYTIPMFGSEKSGPSAALLVSNGIVEKVCPVKTDARNGFKSYIVFNRERYYVENVGTLYSPRYEFVE